MRRLTLVLFLLVTLTGCAVFQHPRETLKDFQTKASQEDFDAWAESIKGPTVQATMGNYLVWHDANMTYTPDGVYDYPRHYLVTFAAKAGDCDDTASMLMAALYRAGGYGNFQPVMLSVFHPGGGHAVCVAKDDATGWFYAASNWPRVFGPCATIRDLAGLIYPDWTRYRMFDFDIDVIEEVNR